MSEPDDLYTLRNLFWLGNYQAAINEANGLTKIPVHIQFEKQEFLYRSYVALGQYSVVKNEIQDSSRVGLRIIRLLATYLQDPANQSLESILASIAQWTPDSTEKTFHIIAATFSIYNQDLKQALKILSSVSSIEGKALTVQIYLKMDRLDLAQQLVKQMKAADEDHVLTILSNAWTLLNIGPSKAQEAAYIYDELVDKYGGSALLLNGLAVAKMHLAQYEEAETILKDAVTKASGDGETFANLVVVSTHLNRPQEVITRYISQLQAKVPNHALLQLYATFQSAYDRVSASYKL